MINLDVEASYTIPEVKDLILNKEGIPTSQQRLSFRGFQLLDCHTLSDYNIQNGDTLTLFKSVRSCPSSNNNMQSTPNLRGGTDSMKIFVEAVRNGRTITVYVEPNDSIDKVKSLIQDQHYIPTRQQIFIFKGQQLEPGCTISDYGIQREDTIDLVLTLGTC
eukprot:scaffold3829_cov45-Cyclotella_meneghiniana.AAC.4